MDVTLLSPNRLSLWGIEKYIVKRESVCRIVSVQQTDPLMTKKEALVFAVMTKLGATVLAFGLALITFAHVHERAYIFLIVGAGGFMGGFAGITVGGQSARVAFDYGLIAMAMVGVVIGLNYLTGEYGPGPNLTYGYLAITVSVLALLVGLIGEMVVLRKAGSAARTSVFVAGVATSIGLAVCLVGTMLLAAHDAPAYGYFLLATGAVCLIGGGCLDDLCPEEARIYVWIAGHYSAWDSRDTGLGGSCPTLSRANAQ
jgi:hypothetical protein